MAYVVSDCDPMRSVATRTLPWAGNYTPWYVQGQNAFDEPVRREDRGGIGPCRAFLGGATDTSGNYRVPRWTWSPLPQGSAS